MNNRNYGLFNTWDLAVVETPPRTNFYNLSPIGIGTGEVESFSSYMSRLALEHSLSIFSLLREVGKKNSIFPDTLTSRRIPSVAGNFNGFGENSEYLISLTERGIPRNDISFTTLIAWKNKWANINLAKKKAAWCASCYEMLRKEKRTIYNKLVWSILHVKFCGIHEKPLINTCPHCHSKFNNISSQTNPGYCSKCYLWLGNEDLSAPEEWNNKEFEIWRYSKMSELILEIPRLPSTWSPKTISQNLEELIKVYTDGNINDFAYLVNVSHMDIRILLRNDFLPSIKTIFSICYTLKISPIELFKNDAKLSSIVCSISVSNEETSPIFKGPVSHNDIPVALSKYMLENPPPSASESARRIGWGVWRLERKFPVEYRTIRERYKSYVKQKDSPLSDEEIEAILKKAAKEEYPPSLQIIFREIGCRNTGFRYYSKFPKLCRAIEAKYKVFNVKRAIVIAETSLTEYPVPSFSEIARRIGCERATLTRRLPALAKLTQDRYNNFIRERIEARIKVR